MKGVSEVSFLWKSLEKALITNREVIEMVITGLKYDVRELSLFQLTLSALTNGRLLCEVGNLVLRSSKQYSGNNSQCSFVCLTN